VEVTSSGTWRDGEDWVRGEEFGSLSRTSGFTFCPRTTREL
jgi:hypothetical protein